MDSAERQAAATGNGNELRPTAGSPVPYEFMWVDISNWEFGHMREELRRLNDLGWEVDGIVDELHQAPAGADGELESVSLRLKRGRGFHAA